MVLENMAVATQITSGNVINVDVFREMHVLFCY
jgi:hypothetical protein